MAGILIYTSSGGSEGTLGGLVRLGRKDMFPNLFKQALMSSLSCSNDPTCNMSSGQGLHSLNLAACYCCTLLPETSCERRNCYLDRVVISGKINERECGVYSNYIFDKEDTICIEPVALNPDVRENEMVDYDVDLGINLADMDYFEIFNNSFSKECDTNSKSNLNAIISRIDLLRGKEKPYKNAKLRVNNKAYRATLLWPDSKVILLSSNLEKNSNIINKTDFSCFVINDMNFSFEDFLSKLKERK